MTLVLAPIRQADAKAFVRQHHRHNPPPAGSIFQVSVKDDGKLVGVAIVGRPVARALDDGESLEVVRVCTDGADNANSMLYGAVRRAAMALGYKPQRLFTYTQEGESGASLRAAGWVVDERLAARAGWTCTSRPRKAAASDNIAKIRWRSAS